MWGKMDNNYYSQLTNKISPERKTKKFLKAIILLRNLNAIYEMIGSSKSFKKLILSHHWIQEMHLLADKPRQSI